MALPSLFLSIGKCAMNVVRFFLIAQYLLVLDRHMMCPVPMEDIGWKGTAKLFLRLELSSAKE